jgi:hypothetical protein
MISTGILAARANARSVLPEAVGPTTATSGGTGFRPATYTSIRR